MTTTTPATTVATGVDDARLAGLRRWNTGLTVLHAAQAVAVLLLASSFAITVTSSYPAGPRGPRSLRRRPCSSSVSGWRSRCSWAWPPWTT